MLHASDGNLPEEACKCMDSMVDGLFFCATLTGRRGGHTPFVQAGAETSDTSAEEVKPDPGSSWEGHSRRVGGRVGDESTEFRRLSNHPALHRWSAQCAAWMLLLSDELMSCCGAGTNGCLDLRRRTFPPGGQKSAEWSRCPGSLVPRARESVAPLRQSSARWMPARIGRLSTGVGRKHPVAIRKASLMAGSMRRVWALPQQTGAQYSAVECTRSRVAIRNVVAPAPQPEPANRLSAARVSNSGPQDEKVWEALLCCLLALGFGKGDEHGFKSWRISVFMDLIISA